MVFSPPPSSLEILERVGAIVRHTHAVGTTGVHLDTYVEISVLEDYPQETAMLCQRMAEFADDVHAVVGPAGGDDFLVEGVAYELTRLLGREIFPIRAYKIRNEGFRIPPDAHRHIQSQRILVVDDVLNTGTTVQRIVTLARELGGNVMGVSVVCTHGVMDEKGLGVPWLHASAAVQSRRWSPEKCRLRGLCKEGVPINPDLGHGAEFLAQQAR